MMTPAPAFPSGLYGRYKRATEFFLNWLLHARALGVEAASADVSSSSASKKSKQKKKGNDKEKDKRGVSLDTYDRIIAAIAKDPSMLTPSIQRRWEHALSACETAITLRTRVAKFFPSVSGGEDDSHAHFLGRLQSWRTLLQTSAASAGAVGARSEAKVDADVKKEAEKPKAVDFSNYYAVLELPEDYFPADADYADTSAAAAETKRSSSSLSAAQRQRMLDEAFENDLHAELSFFFMELDELLEAVHNAFLDVKHQRRTLIEATAVTKLAVDSATSAIARLQLRYPAIRSGFGMVTVIRDWMPEPDCDALLERVLDSWTAPPSAPEYCKYVPGSIIVDMLWLSDTFAGFIASLPPRSKSHLSMNLPGEGPFVAPPYDEEKTPEFVWPTIDEVTPFFHKEFPVLYNKLVRERWSGIREKGNTLEDWFLNIFDDAVSSRTATIPCVFLLVCWARSVAVLQGSGGLTRTISVSIMQRLEIEERLRASVARGAVRRTAPELHGHMEWVVQYFEFTNKSTRAVRANPILAGCVLLDHQFTFQLFGSESSYTVMRLRGFVHIYNALLDQQMLDPIPFLDELLGVDEYAFFKPSREASVRGSYARAFLLSSNATDAIIDAQMGRRPPPMKRKARIGLGEFRFPSFSRLCRLLKHQDFSTLPVTSWKATVAAVFALCSQELYESRVMARDVLTLKDDVMDVFISLRDVLGPDSDMALVDVSGRPEDLSLDSVVILPLLTFLDCLNIDGSISVTNDAVDILKMQASSLRALGEAGLIEDTCRSAATIISSHFALLTREEVEGKFFSLPSSPRWVAEEFGDQPYRARGQGGSQATFDALMEMMERSDGPLHGEQLKQLKDAVMKDPQVIMKGEVDSSKELCTLLHHAAAGPARDRRLLEWLIGMGALKMECPAHRTPNAEKLLAFTQYKPTAITNMLAVHSAAKAGLLDSVCVLLEAGLSRDLDTRTLHTRETLLHLAVKHGHRDVADYLVREYAEARTKAEGRSLASLTTDVAWKRKLIEFAVEQQRQADMYLGAAEKLTPKIERRSVESAEQLRRALAKQRREEQATRHSGLPRK